MTGKPSKTSAKHQANVLSRTPVAVNTFSGPSVVDKNAAHPVWFFRLLGEKGEFLEDGGEYATKAEARAEGEAIKAARRFVELDPNPSKRAVANRVIGRFIERRRMLKEQAEADQRARAERDAAARVEQAAQIARDAEQARESQVHAKMLADGHRLLDDPSLIHGKTSGSLTWAQFGLHALECAGERLDEVRAFRDRPPFRDRPWNKNSGFQRSPWALPKPYKGETEQNKMRTLRRAYPHHPWSPEIA